MYDLYVLSLFHIFCNNAIPFINYYFFFYIISNSQCLLLISSYQKIPHHTNSDVRFLFSNLFFKNIFHQSEKSKFLLIFTY